MASFGATAGGALGGAGTGAAIGTAVPVIGSGIGAGIGALVGGLSGLFGSNEEENNRRLQMMLRAADQRAAPWLAKAGVRTEITPYAMGKSHSADILQGALSGFQQYQAGENSASQNQYRDAMKKLMLEQSSGGKQAKALLEMPNVAASQGASNDEMQNLILQYLNANGGLNA